MDKKYLYFLCQVIFIFCLSCAKVTDSQPPTQVGADSDVIRMQQQRSKMYGSNIGSGEMGLPPGAGPDLSLMQKMRSKMYGGGSVSESVKDLQAMPEAPTPTPKEVDESSELIQQGKELFEAKQYHLAALEFEAFLGDHEYGDLAPEASYYLGESYYRQEKYEEAIKAYKKIDQLYQRYPLAPNAIYRMAKCYEKLGQPQSAQQILKRLKTNHPQFDPAEAEEDEP